MKKWLTIVVLLLELVLTVVALKRISEGDGVFFAAPYTYVDEA